jgi:hypothetical protein
MPQCGVSAGCALGILNPCALLRARQEIRAAKIIFHVSGWQARYRFVAFARRSWFCCGLCGSSVSLRPSRHFFGEVGDWFGPNCGWRSSRNWVSHSVCGSLGGAMLSGDRLFMVSRALLGFTRRQAGVFWDDYYGCRDCVTRAGCVFPRWSHVRAARNRDSALIASTGTLTACVSRANSSTEFRTLLVTCQATSPTTKSGTPSHPPEWYPKTIPSRDAFMDFILHSAVRKQTTVGGLHDLGKLSDFDPKKEDSFCRI